MTIVFIEESTLFCRKSHEGDERMANQFRVSCSSSHRWTSYQLKFIYLYVYFRDIGSYSSLFACAFTLWEENPVESVVPWSAHLLQKGGSCTTRTHWPAQDSQSSWRNVHPLVENLLSGFYSLSTSILGACAWIYSPLLRRRPAQWPWSPNYAYTEIRFRRRTGAAQFILWTMTNWQVECFQQLPKNSCDFSICFWTQNVCGFNILSQNAKSCPLETEDELSIYCLRIPVLSLRDRKMRSGINPIQSSTTVPWS